MQKITEAMQFSGLASLSRRIKTLWKQNVQAGPNFASFTVS